jgi:glycosyltransferase involved in cell wall biosynthesis
MKIMVALHQVMDLGGIINHTEQLIGGLKDLGHTVHLKQFVYADNAYDQRRDGDFINGPSGIPHHQGKGWNFTRAQRIPYRTGAGISTAKQILSGYDLVIWTVPVPSKNKDNLGNQRWIELYDLPKSVKQVAFVHDGNIRQGAPHILAIADRLSGLACVHGCALNGSDFIEVPRALILNPQEMPVRDIADWSNKKPGFVNMQTFKAWKHAHELIQAIAYMPKKRDGELREIAGMGIEYQYMTSEDKCKDEYFHFGVADSEGGPRWFSGMKYWDAAIENGMTHHGYWNTREVEAWLTQARVLVDPSWSKKYSAIGGHWNRVVVDAMIHGVVPIATKMGMGSEIFQPNVHYIPIPPGGEHPQQYAEIILEAGNMNRMEAQHYRDYALDVLPMFDRMAVAKKLLALVNEELDATEVRFGTADREMQVRAEDIMFNHFGVLI